MSAWIVSKKHIDLMVAGISRGTRDGAVKPRRRVKDRLGQKLVDECVKSVAYRYPGSKLGELPGPCDPYYLKPYRFEDPKYLPTAAELAKAIACYRYQSCEHPEWVRSYACRLTERIGQEIATNVPAAKRMLDVTEHREMVWPEYEAAPWGFEWENVALCFAAAETVTGRPLLRALIADPMEATVHKAMIDWLREHDMIPESEGALSALPIPDYVLRDMAPLLVA